MGLTYRDYNNMGCCKNKYVLNKLMQIKNEVMLHTRYINKLQLQLPTQMLVWLKMEHAARSLNM
jgi:hypothetical protein